MELGARTAEVVALGEFDPFFRTTFPGVARAAALVARDPGTGQELAQEAFFRLFERWSDMRSEEHARRFAYRVAINLARSHLRKHVRLVLSGLEPGRSVVEPTSGSTEAWLELREALGALSRRQRAVVVLVDYVDMDAAEAGEVLGISAGTVRAHLMRGRRALRDRLGLDEGEER
jgi:RNA polymerase sigma factor (sigma-70 family)